MLTIWAIIGIIVGIVLGLTGAGGAIISVPIFIQVTQASVHEATTLSLITVLVGAFSTWIPQRTQTQYNVSFLIGFVSVIGSKIFAHFKTGAPAWVVQSAFIVVCLYSLFNTWRTTNSPLPAHSAVQFNRTQILKLSITGILLGGLATFTGLGGGILLVPWLMGSLGFSAKKAVATGLFTVMMTSGGAIWTQSHLFPDSIDLWLFVALSAGCLIAAFLVRWMTKKVEENRLNSIRKFSITLVILFAVLSVAL